MQVNARALDSLDFCGSAHTHARLERIVQSHPLYLNEAEALHTWRSGGDTPGHGSGRVCGSDVSLTQPPLWLLRKFAEVVRQNFDHRSRVTLSEQESEQMELRAEKIQRILSKVSGGGVKVRSSGGRAGGGYATLYQLEEPAVPHMTNLITEETNTPEQGRHVTQQLEETRSSAEIL